MSTTDWAAWHEPYDRPDSSLRRRLAVVERRIGDALDHARPGPIRVISVCAGQGRDLLEVLAHHPRRDDVVARLVELDEGNVAHARRLASAAGLHAVEIVRGDASSTSAYAGVVPADVVLICGVFGNVSMDDIHHTIRHLPSLCAPGATVIWTRHRRRPDANPVIRAWFTEAGFAEVAFDTEDGFLFGVGTATLAADPLRFVEGVQLFDFVGDGTGADI